MHTVIRERRVAIMHVFIACAILLYRNAVTNDCTQVHSWGAYSRSKFNVIATKYFSWECNINPSGLSCGLHMLHGWWSRETFELRACSIYIQQESLLWIILRNCGLLLPIAQGSQQSTSQEGWSGHRDTLKWYHLFNLVWFLSMLRIGITPILGNGLYWHYWRSAKNQN